MIIHFDPAKHPRDPRGLFRRNLAPHEAALYEHLKELPHGKAHKVKLPHGVEVRRLRTGRYEIRGGVPVGKRGKTTPDTRASAHYAAKAALERHGLAATHQKIKALKTGQVHEVGDPTRIDPKDPRKASAGIIVRRTATGYEVQHPYHDTFTTAPTPERAAELARYRAYKKYALPAASGPSEVSRAVHQDRAAGVTQAGRRTVHTTEKVDQLNAPGVIADVGNDIALSLTRAGARIPGTTPEPLAVVLNPGEKAAEHANHAVHHATAASHHAQAVLDYLHQLTSQPGIAHALTQHGESVLNALSSLVGARDRRQEAESGSEFEAARALEEGARERLLSMGLSRADVLCALDETEIAREAIFRPELHPRDRRGKFRELLGKLMPGDIAIVHGHRVVRHSDKSFTITAVHAGGGTKTTVRGVHAAARTLHGAIQPRAPRRLRPHVHSLGTVDRPGLDQPWEFRGLTTGPALVAALTEAVERRKAAATEGGEAFEAALAREQRLRALVEADPSMDAPTGTTPPPADPAPTPATPPIAQPVAQTALPSGLWACPACGHVQQTVGRCAKCRRRKPPPRAGLNAPPGDGQRVPAPPSPEIWEARWDAGEHPRGRGGKWIPKVGDHVRGSRLGPVFGQHHHEGRVVRIAEPRVARYPAAPPVGSDGRVRLASPDFGGVSVVSPETYRRKYAGAPLPGQSTEHEVHIRDSSGNLAKFPMSQVTRLSGPHALTTVLQDRALDHLGERHPDGLRAEPQKDGSLHVTAYRTHPSGGAGKIVDTHYHVSSAGEVRRHALSTRGSAAVAM